MSHESDAAAAALWARAKEVVADAIALPAARRGEFVARRCADDALLQDEVLSILQHAEDATDFIECSPALPRQSPPADSPALSGSRIGAYLLGREIGSGGMGVVYLATRADGAYEQQVAVKILRTGIQPEAAIRRMARERQALAALNHPNIAHLLDGGTSASGLPYLVLEYVDGEAVDAYCTRCNASLAERIDIVRQVCAAVQSAHQQLLIHRDIKPSNILIGRGGIPKLLDFGIARLLARDEPTSGATEDGMLLFTPRYASPEQMRGLAASVATDVYGIGLLLYELLGGASPYARIASAEATNSAATMQVVLEDSPRRASEVAAKSLPAFAKALKGDLDVILQKASAKLPSERYPTVAQLDEDLRRWQESEPILARPPSWWYGLQKFTGRHRAVSLMTVVALVAAGVGVAGILAQKHKTEIRYAEVRQLANSLIFKYYDRIESMGGSAPVRKELAGDGIAFLDSLAKDAGDDPTLAVEIAGGYRKLSEVLFNGRGLSHLGDKARAESTAKKAAALLEPVLARNPADIAANLEMASLDGNIGALLAQEGRGKEALVRMESAAARYETVSRAKPADAGISAELTRTYIATAQAAMNAGLPAEAYLQRGEAAFARYAVLASGSAEVPNMAMFVVRTKFRQAFSAKDYPRALRLADEEIAGITKLRERDADRENTVLAGHLQSAWTSKGVIFIALKQTDDALHALAFARNLAEKIIARDGDNINMQNRLARTHFHTGNAEQLREVSVKALNSFEAALAVYEKLSDKNLPAYAYQQQAEAYARASAISLLLNDNDRAKRHAAALLAFAKQHPAPFEKQPASDWHKAAVLTLKAPASAR